MPRCHGCHGHILDRFILKLGQDKGVHTCWHTACLICCDCNIPLTEKCYLKNNSPYCREDFFKRHAKTRCANCEFGIAPGTIVRRAQDNVYHMDCFACILCKRTLITGNLILYLLSCFFFENLN